MLNDIYALTITGVLQGQRCSNVLHYRVDVDDDVSAFQARLVAYADTTLCGALADGQSINFNWVEASAQKIWPLPAFAPNIMELGQTGGSDDPAMPSEVALVITKRTLLGGVRYRGRMYISGLPQTAMTVATGLWSIDAMNNFNAAALSMSSPVFTPGPAAGKLTPVIWNRTTHVATAITSMLIRNVPRAQRRRQIGKGV